MDLDPFDHAITACGPKIDTWPRNTMLLLKNPQFLPNFF